MSENVTISMFSLTMNVSRFLGIRDSYIWFILTNLIGVIYLYVSILFYYYL